MTRRFAVLLFASMLSTALCAPAWAAKQKPPAGMGKYMLFLKTAPPVKPGQTAKKIVPPDVDKLGGVIVQKKDGYHIIYLPFPALKQLRKDDNVDYLQRVWMGETLEEWQATEAIASNSSVMRLRSASDSLTQTASWGPKNYSYDGSGNIKQIAELDANGNPKPAATEKYRYDGAIRLKEAIVNGITETYTYDSFGNLKQKQTGSDVATLNIDSTSNRVSNFSYDIAGNVTRDPRKSYSWDSMGMLNGLSQNTKRMFYDASDERVGFTLGSSGDFSRWIISDFEGRPLREFRSDDPLSYYQDAEWIWTEDWVYAGDQLVGGETAGPWGVDQATIPVDRRRRHYHVDHLGSVRLMTTETGAISLGVHNYYPYGTEQSLFYQEEYNFGGTGGIRPEPLRFTGHYRDYNGYWNAANTDQLDYMHARFYDPNQSRFISPDQARSAVLDHPQTWNRYIYADDNPTGTVDRNGNWPTKAVSILGVRFDFRVHQWSIENILESRVSKHDLKILQDAQVTADLDQFNQYKHAMSLPGQAPKEAIRLANEYIKSTMDRAIAKELAGKHDTAVLLLGLAMHVLQDATAYPHEGGKMWDPKLKDSSWAHIQHAIQELYYPLSMSPEGKALMRATWNAWAFFANATGQQVIKPQCGAEICPYGQEDPSDPSTIQIPSPPDGGGDSGGSGN